MWLFFALQNKILLNYSNLFSYSYSIDLHQQPALFLQHAPLSAPFDSRPCPGVASLAASSTRWKGKTGDNVDDGDVDDDDDYVDSDDDNDYDDDDDKRLNYFIDRSHHNSSGQWSVEIGWGGEWPIERRSNRSDNSSKAAGQHLFILFFKNFPFNVFFILYFPHVVIFSRTFLIKFLKSFGIYHHFQGGNLSWRETMAATFRQIHWK